MNFSRQCVGATATLPLSLSSRTFLRTYSTNLWFPEHSSSSIRSPEVNEPMADSSHPREIPYLTNLVKLLAHIKLPVKFQSFPDGKHYAATLISDAYKPIDKACLIPVLFEGNLAHVVSSHVKEFDCVYVTGKLCSDPFPFLLQDNQLPLHILADNIKFVEGFHEKPYDYSRKKEIIDNVKNSMNETSDHRDLWKDLMKNPNQWVSFVDDKSKGLVPPKLPDFRHKENGSPLWLDRAPEWFLARIENLDLDSHCSKDKMWKSLAENPDKWRDNRAHKKTEKAPDFKHKKTGLGLWLGDSPEWYVAMDIGLLKDTEADAWKSLVENLNQWVSFVDDKSKGLVSPKHPDFKHTENGNALWLAHAPECFLARIESLVLDSHCNKEKMWKSLAENPNQWVSFKDDKSKGLVSPKHPNFKHIENGNALWLAGAPQWFLARIESLDLDSHCSKEKMWKSLAKNPDQWQDNRAHKKTKKAPDFKHKKTCVGLWLGNAPDWFVAKDIEKLMDTEAEAWKSLVENPNQWVSFVDDKSKGLVPPKYPDFRHTDNGASLWLISAPEWFLARIESLDLDTHCSKEKMWKSLAENPDEWRDHRAHKKTEKAPDFKHKKTGVGLWLGDAPDWFVAKDISKLKDTEEEAWKCLVENPNQWVSFVDDKSKGLVPPKHPDFRHTENATSLWLISAPEWFLARIESLDLDTHCSKEKMWKSLAEIPDQWWDDRAHKNTEKAPDFKHKKTCVGLWLGDAPEWFLAKDIEKPKDTEAEAWKSLVENPIQWWDNRLVKKYVNSSDFMHKDSGERLWLNRAPDWVVSKLPPLKQKQNVGGV